MSYVVSHTIALDCLGNVYMYKGEKIKDMVYMNNNDFIKYVQDFHVGDSLAFTKVYSSRELEKLENLFKIEGLRD